MVLKTKNNFEKVKLAQFFTPEYVAEFMVLNIDNLISSDLKKEELKVLEPCAGEGIFLRSLLAHQFKNITAYELDTNLKDKLLNLFPEVKFQFKNFLGSSIEEKYDIIIGNPPYLGQNYNAQIFQDLMKNYPICRKYFVGNMDLFYFFIHLGILKLNPGGLLSFITTNYWITKSKKTGIKLLKPHILDESYILQYLDLTNLNLFKNATGQHNCIFTLQKKTQKEKAQELDKTIEIISIRAKKDVSLSDATFNEKIFNNLIRNKNSNYIKRYVSSITNNDLKQLDSWNIAYPPNVKSIVNNIEYYCRVNNKISYLNDYFIIRNGLIFIKDDIFILKEGNNLKIEKEAYFIKIGKKFSKLNNFERNKLKKIYKSRSIKPYGFDNKGFIGYAIYLNKNEFNLIDPNTHNRKLEEKYPNLTKYINQFKEELQAILINAKENPKNHYFPRRGALIRKLNKKSKEQLVDLEPLYDNSKKIFLKYITDQNNFGYTDDSYYATSDTYFLWPKDPENVLDYLFLIAYLNSKIVNFLFKARNISLKRSKTKLEYNLPIPNLDNFESKEKISLLKLIRIITSWLIERNNLNRKSILEELSQRLIHIKSDLTFLNQGLFKEIEDSLTNNNEHNLQNILNLLFFKLFDISPKEIDNIIQNYYQ